QAGHAGGRDEQSGDQQAGVTVPVTAAAGPPPAGGGGPGPHRHAGGGCAPGGLGGAATACANSPGVATPADTPAASGRNEATTPADTVVAAKTRPGRSMPPGPRLASRPFGPLSACPPSAS